MKLMMLEFDDAFVVVVLE